VWVLLVEEPNTIALIQAITWLARPSILQVWVVLVDLEEDLEQLGLMVILALTLAEVVEQGQDLPMVAVEEAVELDLKATVEMVLLAKITTDILLQLILELEEVAVAEILEALVETAVMVVLDIFTSYTNETWE
jgi:hypothetical protein